MRETYFNSVAYQTLIEKGYVVARNKDYLVLFDGEREFEVWKNVEVGQWVELYGDGFECENPDGSGLTIPEAREEAERHLAWVIDVCVGRTSRNDNDAAKPIGLPSSVV